MKKVIFLLLFPLIAEVVISCCNCMEPVIRRYTNKTISVEHLDNSGSEAVVSTSGSVTKKAYGIRLRLIREQLACIQQRKSLFIQSAYAYSCGCEPALQFLAKDSITSIKVYTLNDFDGTHPAGSDLSGYFKVYSVYNFMTIEDYLKYMDVTLYAESQLDTRIDLLLMTAPVLTGQHQFKVQLTLSDGRTLETETSTIELH
ncbi:DUF5034 domain-containing protein [Pseudoflavitalea sp. X16]|uniref:DUF5034 domain-containing protein n=1 Tax=Paraflavitalea devenefica TaxID=2716334 RepID=UPI001421EE23|nr:DUF5034 domain-containing protein [Paraflavitalea devenefica]NII23795.1 DUF5034 domain-containing protein [Paraflavitalea devenefica]